MPNVRVRGPIRCGNKLGPFFIVVPIVSFSNARFALSARYENSKHLNQRCYALNYYIVQQYDRE